MTEKETDKMEKIVSLAKRRGFIYQGSEIYGGLAGTWDYGPLGVALKNNIRSLWWKMFVDQREDMYGIDAAILMNPRVWESVGHVDGFNDPLVEDLKTKKRYRADHLLEDAGVSNVAGMDIAGLNDAIQKHGVKSPDGNPLGDVRQFNMMFSTKAGAHDDDSAVVYLRPETAQGMFVNFKNIIDSFHPRLPFGMGQVGKAFRNEIAPRDFIFRTREFEQMEIEYFVREEEWERHFEAWRVLMWDWIKMIGLSKDRVHELDVPEEDRAHYSTKTIDFEYDFPFGRKELYGLAYRTDFDLGSHMKASKTKLEYLDDETNTKVVPHVIEPTFGLDRTVLALLSEAYTEDRMGDGERVFLKLHPRVAPIKVAVFPLKKNDKSLQAKARDVFDKIKASIPEVMYDDNANVGKRYRRQDEIGTPFCITIDFDTLEGEGEAKDTVTLRERDTGNQKRVPISDLVDVLQATLGG